MKALLSALAIPTLLATAFAQVPEGYYAFCTFGSAGRQGVFFQHPRNADTPIAVEGLNPDLAWNPNGRAGGACLVIRPSDGALIVGERAAAGNSVDLHVMRLNGNTVAFDQLFSVGTAGPAGEIPQCAILPDGRILVAATDLVGGPLANVQTNTYGLEGLGIIDPIGGGVIPVPIANPAVFASGVFNGMALSPDGLTAYLANYVSSTVGEVWSIPVPAGGNATLLATVTPVSGLGFDQDGSLLIVTLNGPPNLWKHDFATGLTTAITTTNGPLNAIALETVTGNYAVATANGGIPSRSLCWMEPNGTDHLIISPGLATISGVDVSPNPRTFGEGTPGNDTHTWALQPNPGGMPLVGNASFSLTLEAPSPTNFDIGACLIAFGAAPAPISVLGIDILVDLTLLAGSPTLPPTPSQTIPLPIPSSSALVGGRLYLQAVHATPGGLTATRGLRFTIL